VIYVKLGNDYFINGDTTKTGIVAEFFALQNEIKAIDNDPEITHKDAVRGISAKRLKQARLKSKYNQIIAQ